ncbi:hypothetical protein GW17_00010710 [Ensete ventricosum]|nr:hypothetical protein GW17_00010710 [Ensete ventricosum]
MAEEAILGFLQTNDEITDSHEFAAGIEVDHTYLVNVIKRLNGFEILEAKVLPFGSLSVYRLRIIISLAKRGKCMQY